MKITVPYTRRPVRRSDLESNAAFLGVAICDFNNSKTPKIREKNRRRILRMLSKYTWHIEIILLAERTIRDVQDDERSLQSMW